MKIAPSEYILIGKWCEQEGRLVADETAQRIASLAATYLQRIASDASGWLTLYRDPADGRLWELTYPQSDSHGGGPAMLRQVSTEEAAQRYGLDF